MTDDREVFKVRREAGLAKRHETRLENATYTAAEVRVLTEAALRLGRKEGGEEVLGAVDGWMSTADDELYDEWCSKRGAVRAAFGLDARPLPSGAVSDERSGGGA